MVCADIPEDVTLTGDKAKSKFNYLNLFFEMCEEDESQTSGVKCFENSKDFLKNSQLQIAMMSQTTEMQQ